MEDYVKINLEKELEKYQLVGKWNDYIGVQKAVLIYLRESGYFEKSRIVNRASGMFIAVTAKGIKETLGTGKRFQSLPKVLKQLKVATLWYLPVLIEQAEVLEDEVESIHDLEKYRFAYLGACVEVDEEVYKVRISIKKKVESNIFWIHHIDYTKKDFALLDPSKKKE